ncbi:MAG: hypothetical protein C0467_30375 [Planctomycetaceae bacterium]|nr:hypothetical protein [Planctomycetaceae bacterium]
MLLCQIQRGRGRRGSAIVEAALTLTVFSLLLFGIFEYCRYLFVLHVTNLAAREGVRYAAVNTDKPTNFDTVDYTDAAGRTYTNILAYTKNRLAGTDNQIVGYQAAVYAVDSVGLTLATPVIRPKSKSASTYPDPFNASDTNKVSWNAAGFPDRLAVQIRGTFRPFLPNVTLMPNLPVNVISLTGVEG